MTSDRSEQVFLVTCRLSLVTVFFDDGIELFRCRCGPKFGRGEDGMLEGRAALTAARLRTQAADGRAHDHLRVTHVLVQILDDRLDRDGIVSLVPAIVIGDERERGVT